jgi:hypothetical protein
MRIYRDQLPLIYHCECEGVRRVCQSMFEIPRSLVNTAKPGNTAQGVSVDVSQPHNLNKDYTTVYGI